MDPEILYFGCRGEPGHHIHCKRSIVRLRDTPWNTSIDGGLLAQTSQSHQGLCIHAVKDGWTAVSFWDRSGDSRPNSNSAFLVREEMTPFRLLELARQQWPDVFARHRFPDLSYQPAA